MPNTYCFYKNKGGQSIITEIVQLSINILQILNILKWVNSFLLVFPVVLMGYLWRWMKFTHTFVITFQGHFCFNIATDHDSHINVKPHGHLRDYGRDFADHIWDFDRNILTMHKLIWLIFNKLDPFSPSRWPCSRHLSGSSGFASSTNSPASSR